ncbi:AraC family transcriptional regulator [Paenibacillus sp. J5C_2022]|nr:AraC family transcriptional regulator [Paenibacillus sp. J5C2022]
MSQSVSTLPSMGILQFHQKTSPIRLERFAPHESLSPFVLHYWLVSWDLPGETIYLQDVIPNPCANLVVEKAGSGLYGVPDRIYTKRLTGRGRAFGVKFKPGGLYPYIRKPLAELRNSRMNIADAFPCDDSALCEAFRDSAPADTLIRLSADILSHQLPQADPIIHTVNDIINDVKHTDTITTVEQMCSNSGIHIRKLQRLFQQYVGVTPKWVIKLYRMQNVAEQLDKGYSGGWMELALSQGYYDQPHFIRDFKSIIGVTPEQYVQSSLSAREQ